MFTPQDRSKNKPHSANLVRRSGLASIGFRVSRLRTVYGARAAHIQPLQNVLNGAARLILHKRKYDHITSDIRDRLHWLPIQHRLEYKICLLIFKFLHQKAPVYLAVMSDPVSASATAEVISHRQHAAIWRYLGHVRRLTDKEVIPSLVRHCGTRCRSLSVTQL